MGIIREEVFGCFERIYHTENCIFDPAETMRCFQVSERRLFAFLSWEFAIQPSALVANSPKLG